MLYSILIYVDESLVEAMTQAEEEAHIEQHLRIHEQLAARGKLGPVVRLMPTRTALQVRTEGEPLLIDGPFAETKEQFLGFYLIDCESIEEAAEIARSLPSVKTVFEIRPVKLFFPGNALAPASNDQDV